MLKLLKPILKHLRWILLPVTIVIALLFVEAATDSYGKTTSKDLVISPSSAAARVEEVVPTDVWARHATVHGLILKASAENPGISYRRVGDTAWTPAKVTVSGSEMSAVITGLTPATAY